VPANANISGAAQLACFTRSIIEQFVTTNLIAARPHARLALPWSCARAKPYPGSPTGESMYDMPTLRPYPKGADFVFATVRVAQSSGQNLNKRFLIASS
jgi:hypothetical protein